MLLFAPFGVFIVDISTSCEVSSVFHHVPDQQFPQLIMDCMEFVLHKEIAVIAVECLSFETQKENLEPWPQSWLCDGAWCRCAMQSWVQSDAAPAECQIEFSAMNRLDRLKILCSQKLLQNHYQWSFYLNEIFDAK